MEGESLFSLSNCASGRFEPGRTIDPYTTNSQLTRRLRIQARRRKTNRPFNSRLPPILFKSTPDALVICIDGEEELPSHLSSEGWFDIACIFRTFDVLPSSSVPPLPLLRHEHVENLSVQFVPLLGKKTENLEMLFEKPFLHTTGGLILHSIRNLNLSQNGNRKRHERGKKGHHQTSGFPNVWDPRKLYRMRNRHLNTRDGARCVNRTK